MTEGPTPSETGAPTVVLGSNSFTGAHHVAYLLERGERVIGVSRSPQPSQVFLPHARGDAPGFEFHQLDLNHDLDAILDLVRDARAACVVSFAAQSMVAQSWERPLDWLRTNVLAHVALHEGLRRFDFLRRYVHVSTPEVYGSCSGLVSEDAPLNPSTPYAVSRAACDLSLRAYFRNYGFPVVWTRAANVFGPCQQLYRIVPRTALFALTGRRLKLEGGGRSVRSFIHVRDVVEGTWLAAARGRAGEVYHLSTSRHVSIREVVEEVCRQVGAPFEDVVEVVGDRPGKDAAYLLDTRKAQAELGWQPARTFEEGVRETIDWVRQNLDELRAAPADYVHRA